MPVFFSKAFRFRGWLPQYKPPNSTRGKVTNAKVLNHETAEAKTIRVIISRLQFDLRIFFSHGWINHQLDLCFPLFFQIEEVHKFVDFEC